jgi:tRNA(Ile)-lysidine synthase
MALAFLCKKLQEENLEFGKYLRDGSFTSLSYLRAFIVDHGAREGSAKEARQVADWLMKIGTKFVWLIASPLFLYIYIFFYNYPLW